MNTNEQVAVRLENEFQPIGDLLKAEIMAPSAELGVPVQESVGMVEGVIMEASGVEESVEQDQPTQNDCLADTDELVRQVNEFHGNVERCETEALLNAWEAGTCLNTLKDSQNHGDWEAFLEENLPGISLSTVWRYRQLAKSFTLKDLAGLTVSAAYAKLGLVKLQDEISTEDSGGSTGTSLVPKTQSSEANLISKVAKAAKKFDVPSSLSQPEWKAVETLCVLLENVHGRVTGPSILGLEWQTKIENDVSDWTEAEVILFNQDFARLQAVNQTLDLSTLVTQEVAGDKVEAPCDIVTPAVSSTESSG